MAESLGVWSLRLRLLAGRAAGPGGKLSTGYPQRQYVAGVSEFVSIVGFQQILIRTSCLMYFDYLLVNPLVFFDCVS